MSGWRWWERPSVIDISEPTLVQQMRALFAAKDPHIAIHSSNSYNGQSSVVPARFTSFRSQAAQDPQDPCKAQDPHMGDNACKAQGTCKACPPSRDVAVILHEPSAVSRGECNHE